MKEIELIPRNGRKSFYGKAFVKFNSTDDAILESYRTEICQIVNGQLVKLFDGENFDSNTTMSHIYSFCELMGVPKITIKKWREMPKGGRV